LFAEDWRQDIRMDEPRVKDEDHKHLFILFLIATFSQRF
jgi:hypothetical protein